MGWITLDVGLPEHPKLLELPNDAARYGWVVTLCAAKRQSRPGQFSSELHYRGVVHGYAKYLPDYCRVGLLERDEDGVLHIHDWERHQWAVRQRRHRDGSITTAGRERDATVTVRGRERDASVTDTDTYTYTDTESSLRSLSARARGGPDALVDYQTLTGRFPIGRVRSWLDDLIERHGHGPLSVALAEEMQLDGKVATLLSRTRDRLEKAAYQAEERRAAEDRQRELRYQRELESKAKAQTPEQRARTRALLDQAAAVVKGLP